MDLEHSAASVTEAIGWLRAEAYDGDLEVDGPLLLCGTCHRHHPPSEAGIERIVRIEGPSDPADEAVVFGLVCAHCGARGVLVTAYGPSASPDEAAVLTALIDSRS